MDEADAKLWFQAEFNVPRETLDRLEAFCEHLRAESEVQNLVSRSSLEHLWTRHIVDSAQLLRLATSLAAEAGWLDLGTGAGFPGLIVALLHPGAVTLIEERRKRSDFLVRAAEALGVSDKTEILPHRAERVEARPFDVISARAFAPLDRLFEIGTRFSTEKTLWILPKGRNARAELEAVQSSWQGAFRLEPSLTDADAHIIVAEQVRPRHGRKSSR